MVRKTNRFFSDGLGDDMIYYGVQGVHGVHGVVKIIFKNEYYLHILRWFEKLKKFSSGSRELEVTHEYTKGSRELVEFMNILTFLMISGVSSLVRKTEEIFQWV